MAHSKINHAARWAAQHDRDLGIRHVMRDHTPLGVMHRVEPDVGLEDAFASYQLLESGVAARQMRADAIRLLVLVGA